MLSFAFWAIGLPYWLLLGLLAGVVEIIPVVGPLLAGIASVGVALTVSVEAAVLTAIAVYGLRLLQDYLIQPKVMGNTVGIAPLAILVVVTGVGLLFGAGSCRSPCPSRPSQRRSPTSSFAARARRPGGADGAPPVRRPEGVPEESRDQGQASGRRARPVKVVQTITVASSEEGRFTSGLRTMKI